MRCGVDFVHIFPIAAFTKADLKVPPRSIGSAWTDFVTTNMVSAGSTPEEARLKMKELSVKWKSMTEAEQQVCWCLVMSCHKWFYTFTASHTVIGQANDNWKLRKNLKNGRTTLTRRYYEQLISGVSKRDYQGLHLRKKGSLQVHSFCRSTLLVVEPVTECRLVKLCDGCSEAARKSCFLHWNP